MLRGTREFLGTHSFIFPHALFEILLASGYASLYLNIADMVMFACAREGSGLDVCESFRFFVDTYLDGSGFAASLHWLQHSLLSP